MLNVTGLIAIPSDPQVTYVDAKGGTFINFKGTTQGKTIDGKAEYQYWNCSVWVNPEQMKKWQEDYLLPGTVLYIEHGQAISMPSSDGKFTFTKIKLEHFKTRKLSVPYWFEE